MSNGDDVLDDWEEIDEARLNNTLQKIEAVRKSQQQQQITHQQFNNYDDDESAAYETFTSTAIQREFQPMKLLQRTPNAGGGSATPGTGSAGTGATNANSINSPLDDMAATFQPVMMVLHKSNDEYQSANYQPAITSQTVKILRRPTQSSEPRNNNGVKPKQPIKTLQQREQEYAEARLRILGSAKNPEDDVAAGNATTAASTPNSSSTPPTITANSGKVNASPRTPTGNHPFNQQQQQQQQPPQTPQQNYYYQQQIQPAYNNRTPLLATTPAAMPAMQHHQQQQHPHATPGAMPLQQTWSPVVGGSVSSLMLRQQQQQQPLPVSQQESILRLPHGPDGSTGFQMRR